MPSYGLGVNLGIIFVYFRIYMLALEAHFLLKVPKSQQTPLSSLWFLYYTRTIARVGAAFGIGEATYNLHNRAFH
jgi:hypothetical protein